METVTNVVNAASEAIWGKQPTAEEQAAHNETGGEEPISGVKGAGNAEEPFDKGNEATSTTTPATTAQSSTSTSSAIPQSDNFLKLQDAGGPLDKPTSTAVETIATKSEAADLVPSSKPASEVPASSERAVESVPEPKTTAVTATSGIIDVPITSASKDATPVSEPKAVKQDTPETSTDAGETSEPKKTSKLGKLKDKLHIGSSKHN